MIVTDHHRPGDALPDCPVVATRPSDYPFPELCGTGVVYKLAEALLGPGAGSAAGKAGDARLEDRVAFGAPGAGSAAGKAGDARLEDRVAIGFPGDELLARHLDLVALATIADVVPLVDENRALAIAGLRRLATTTRPGLRALMRAARVDPAVVDEGAVGFRLAPRINAAGRLGRPTAALELLLTEDEDEAARIAQELEELNRERQAVEERILREASAAIDAWPEAKRAPARLRRRRRELARRRDRDRRLAAGRALPPPDRSRSPARDGDWKGSGRSIPAFDLHAGLAACSGHLERFGGHRAAAGLSIKPDAVEALAEAFAEYADKHLDDDDLRPVTTVDAIVPGAALTLDLCAELKRLAPFGLGNPGVTLLAADCELGELAAVGEGKHLRFRVRDHGRPAGSAIAFGLGPQLDRYRRVGRYDVAFRLEENTWNGTSSPQLVVRRIFETPGPIRRSSATGSPAEWRSKQHSPEGAAIFAELGLEEGGPWRSLLESEAFRALLETPPLAQAA